SMTFATLYALGHAFVVFVLGFAAIVLAEELPVGVDGVMERVVGATLIALGVYVFVSLVRHGRDFRMRSRWMLVFAGVRRAARWARDRGHAGQLVIVDHDHDHTHDGDHHGGRHVPAGAAAEQPQAGAVAVATRHRHGHRHIGRL